MKTKLKSVRLAFFKREAEQYEGQGPFRYNAIFLVEPGSENDKIIEAAIKEEAEREYGKKADAMLKAMRGNSQKFCYLDGNTKDYEGFENMMYLSAHRKREDGPPTYLDRDKTPLVEADGKPYSGCYVNPVVSIYAQTGKNAGIRCGLIGIQFDKHGDAFSGAARSDPNDFDDLGVEEEDEDSLV